ncbi:helix-turn-helix domain-containing protein [Streptomyces brevispora]|uniref:helix-turn-helix domain-containing protein n=1 Tax=Streptomyces brevispora TaxID=887462 RepID=UPI00371E38B9
MTSNMARLATSYRPRLRGDGRATMGRSLAEKYVAGASIRAVAEGADLSYGTARTLLLEAKVALRSRGGARPRG